MSHKITQLRVLKKQEIQPNVFCKAMSSKFLTENTTEA
jgi:hypothetical protein